MILVPMGILNQDPDIGPFGYAQEGFIIKKIKLDELEPDDDDYDKVCMEFAVRMCGAYKVTIAKTKEGTGFYQDFLVHPKEEYLYPLNSPIKILYKKEKRDGFGEFSGFVIPKRDTV